MFDENRIRRSCEFVASFFLLSLPFCLVLVSYLIAPRVLTVRRQPCMLLRVFRCETCLLCVFGVQVRDLLTRYTMPQFRRNKAHPTVPVSTGQTRGLTSVEKKRLCTLLEQKARWTGNQRRRPNMCASQGLGRSCCWDSARPTSQHRWCHTEHSLSTDTSTARTTKP